MLPKRCSYGRKRSSFMKVKRGPIALALGSYSSLPDAGLLDGSEHVPRHQLVIREWELARSVAAQ